MDLPKTTEFVSGANRGLENTSPTSSPAGVLASTVGAQAGNPDTSTGVTPSSWTSPIPAQ